MSESEAGRRIDVPPSASLAADATAPLPDHRGRRRARRRRNGLAVVIAIVCVIGTAVMLFPSVAAWFSQLEQSQQVNALDSEIKNLGDDVLQDELTAAHAYNDELIGGVASVAANERLPLAVNPEQEGDYEHVLTADDEGLMARVRIPAINLDLPIYHGTEESVLQKGVGHLEGTALPVGGLGTHSVLTGHRGLATSELFTNLDQVEVGDTFTIEVFGEVLTYQVNDVRVVEPEDTETLVPRQGEDLVTLITCTPLGVNSHRILVTGERILPTPVADIAAAGRHPDVPGFPWWSVILGGVILLAVVYVWWSGRPVLAAGARKRRGREPEHRREAGEEPGPAGPEPAATPHPHPSERTAAPPPD